MKVVAEEQAGFRVGRGKVAQLILIRQQMSKKYLGRNRPLYTNFRQVFDTVCQQGVWQVLIEELWNFEESGGIIRRYIQ